jgi:RNA recognition motif-containing protein
MNLYVKGFDPATTKEELEAFFSEYGVILSIKVLPGAGMGFVCFTDKDGAKKAVEEGPNKIFKGRNMFITYCQPKEVRQVQLEEKKDKQIYDYVKQKKMIQTIANQIGGVDNVKGVIELLKNITNQKPTQKENDDKVWKKKESSKS